MKGLHFYFKKNPFVFFKMKVCVFVMYHDDASLQFIKAHYGRYLDRWMFPLKITSTRYMESIVFLEELDRPEVKERWATADLVGCIGWKWKKKEVPEQAMSELMDALLASPPSAFKEDGGRVLIHFLRMCGNIFRPCYHPRMEEIMNRLLRDHMGFPEEQLAAIAEIPFFPCNYWMTSPGLMTRYMAFLREARTAIETDPVLVEMLMEDAKYEGTLPWDRLVELMDRPYYTYHCFVMERLCCVFFWKEKISLRFCHKKLILC
jgi:hypothetical protein